MPRPSYRGLAVEAYSYGMFPVPEGAVDLRGDGLASCALLRSISACDSIISLETYEDPRGMPALRNLLATFLGVSEREVLITNGASEAIALMFLSALDATQRVSLPRPCFSAYEQLASLFGLRVEPYVVGRALSSDCVERIRSANLLVLIEPHNPTGIAHFPDVRREASRDAWTVTDLSHSNALFSRSACRSLAPSDLCIGTLSKVLRLPGLRVGFLVARQPELLAAAASIKTHLSMATSTTTQSLALKALSDIGLRQRIREQQVELATARSCLKSAIDQSATLRVIGGESGSHLLVESDVDEDDDALWTRLSSAGVVGLPGKVFEAPYPCVRLCYGQPTPTVATAAERLSRC